MAAAAASADGSRRCLGDGGWMVEERGGGAILPAQ